VNLKGTKFVVWEKRRGRRCYLGEKCERPKGVGGLKRKDIKRWGKKGGGNKEEREKQARGEGIGEGV